MTQEVKSESEKKGVFKPNDTNSGTFTKSLPLFHIVNVQVVRPNW